MENANPAFALEEPFLDLLNSSLATSRRVDPQVSEDVIVLRVSLLQKCFHSSGRFFRACEKPSLVGVQLETSTFNLGFQSPESSKGLSCCKICISAVDVKAHIIHPGLQRNSRVVTDKSPQRLEEDELPVDSLGGCLCHSALDPH